MENLPQPLLRFAIPAPHDLGASNVVEICLGLIRDSSSKQGLTGPRGPVQQKPLGGSMPSRWKSSGCRNGSSTISLTLGDGRTQSSNIIIGHVGPASFLGLLELRPKFHHCFLGHLHRYHEAGSKRRSGGSLEDHMQACRGDREGYRPIPALFR